MLAGRLSKVGELNRGDLGVGRLGGNVATLTIVMKANSSSSCWSVLR
jgi:hypothetical protein